MNCSSCGKPMVLTESHIGGNKKFTCQSCGESRLVDSQGRGYLTGDMGSSRPPQRETSMDDYNSGNGGPLCG